MSGLTGLTGTGRLMRLAIRRDRFVLPAWIIGMAAFLAATTAMFDSTYTKHPELLEPDTRIVVGNVGMRVLGLVTGPSVGAYTLHRDAVTLSVLAAVMSVLAVVRHTRQAEEQGRAELLGAGVVGRDAALGAAVGVALLADIVLAPLLGLAMVVAGQPVSGSLVAGASISLVGIVFTGVAAVTSQVASTTRGAIGLAGAGVGLSFLLAALGNVLGEVDLAALRVSSAWPAWLSPLGWGQQMRPFADNLWWPSGLAAAATVAMFAVAVVLVRRRDVGRGLWPERRGRGSARRQLLSTAGLVWRLQRGALAGWALALAVFGLVFGALSEQIQGLQGDATDWYSSFGGDVDLIGAYWASMMKIAGMTVGLYVVMLLLRLHHDEAQGTMEPVLAGAVSRHRLLGAYAANALVAATVLIGVFAIAMVMTGAAALGDGGTLTVELARTAAVQLPAVGVLGATVLLVMMLVPRWAVGVSWVLVAVTIAVGPMFGPSLGLPAWLVDLSPFSHVPNVPAVAMAAGPLVVLGGAAVALTATAGLVLRRRNLALPA